MTIRRGEGTARQDSVNGLSNRWKLKETRRHVALWSILGLSIIVRYGIKMTMNARAKSTTDLTRFSSSWT